MKVMFAPLTGRDLEENRMKVYVCVKNVPDTAANIRVVGENSFNESVCRESTVPCG